MKSKSGINDQTNPPTPFPTVEFTPGPVRSGNVPENRWLWSTQRRYILPKVYSLSENCTWQGRKYIWTVLVVSKQHLSCTKSQVLKGPRPPSLLVSYTVVQKKGKLQMAWQRNPTEKKYSDYMPTCAQPSTTFTSRRSDHVLPTTVQSTGCYVDCLRGRQGLPFFWSEMSISLENCQNIIPPITPCNLQQV